MTNSRAHSPARLVLHFGRYLDNRDYSSFGGNVERCPPAAIPPPGSQGQAATDGDAAEADPFPGWFTALLQEATRKPSAHTTKAYRQDFLAIASLAIGRRSCPHGSG